MNLSKLGFTANQRKILAEKGINSVEDLQEFFPREYRDYSKNGAVLPIRVDDVTLDGESWQPIITAICATKNKQTLRLLWFNQEKRYEQICRMKGNYYYVPTEDIQYDYSGKMYIANPKSLFNRDDGYPSVAVVYPSLPGIQKNVLREKINRALTKHIPDTLPKNYNESYMSKEEAVKALHFPNSTNEVKTAERRVVLDELIDFAHMQYKSKKDVPDVTKIAFDSHSKTDMLISTLPYKLTTEQENALKELYYNVKNGRRLNVLLQGSVGSGKNIVAFLLASAFVENGYQVVITETSDAMVRENYANLKKLLGDKGIVPLIKSMRSDDKSMVMKAMKNGKAGILVCTQDMIDEYTKFKKLGLVISDEDHTVGIIRSKMFMSKASKGIHTLTVSSTSIPYSLAETLYGEEIELLDINMLPAGRRKVKTEIVSDRKKMLDFIASVVQKGKQVYIVCPVVNQDEESKYISVKNAEKSFGSYMKMMNIRYRSLTGLENKDATDNILMDFKEGKTDVLITVPTIDLDLHVPNVTAMIVMSASQFGLFDIHKMRSRISKGSSQAYCYLEVGKNDETALEKLKLLCSTNDGLRLAKEDLKERRLGSLVSKGSSGIDRFAELYLAFPDLYEEAKLLAVDIFSKKRIGELDKKKIL